MSHKKASYSLGLDDSPTSSAAVMEEQSYSCTHSLGHTGPVTASRYHFLLFYGEAIFFCGHKILAESVSVTQLYSNAGILI